MLTDDSVLGRYNGLVIMRLEMLVTDAIARSKSTIDTRPCACRYCFRPFVYELDVLSVPFGCVQYVNGDVCEACRQASEDCKSLS